MKNRGIKPPPFLYDRNEVLGIGQAWKVIGVFRFNPFLGFGDIERGFGNLVRHCVGEFRQILDGDLQNFYLLRNYLRLRSSNQNRQVRSSVKYLEAFPLRIRFCAFHTFLLLSADRSLGFVLGGVFGPWNRFRNQIGQEFRLWPAIANYPLHCLRRLTVGHIEEFPQIFLTRLREIRGHGLQRNVTLE